MGTSIQPDDLNAAIAAEYAIKAEAMQKGLVATKPLTVIRLAELCALGEQMLRAERRTAEAHRAAFAAARREWWGAAPSRETT